MLKTWLERQTRHRAEIASEIGVSAVSLWRIAEGKQTPRPKIAVAIERVTGIPATYWATEAANRARAASTKVAA